LPVALLEVRKHDRKDELPFPVVVEFNHDIFFATGKNAAQSKLGMFDLRALGERRFVRHLRKNLYIIINEADRSLLCD
jgi:hypothetical protein